MIENHSVMGRCTAMEFILGELTNGCTRKDTQLSRWWLARTRKVRRAGPLQRPWFSHGENTTALVRIAIGPAAALKGEPSRSLPFIFIHDRLLLRVKLMKFQ